MRPAEVRQHWETLAERHGAELDATTKTPTIKRLEVAALLRAVGTAGVSAITSAEILEVGCGNGRNCIELAAQLPAARLTGVDYVPQMIENARLAGGGRSVQFEVGDVLALSEHPALLDEYDVVFTDRCLINLASLEEQLVGLDQLAAKVAPGGHLIILENTRQAFARQNDLRESGGLSRRTEPEHNLFIDEAPFLARAASSLELVFVDEFAALHDLLLYVLVPMANGGTVDYADPLVEAATRLLLARPDAAMTRDAGQNRLYLFRSPRPDVR